MKNAEGKPLIYKDVNGVEVQALEEFLGVDVKGHYYDGLTGKEYQRIQFQLGTVLSEGVNGWTNEALLAVLIHRTKFLDAKFPCEENKRAINHMEDALANFEVRTARRVLRGVEGKFLI